MNNQNNLQQAAYGGTTQSVMQSQGLNSNNQSGMYSTQTPMTTYQGVNQQQYTNQNSILQQQQILQQQRANEYAANGAQVQQQQQQYANFEKSAATILMGLPNSVHAITNPRTGQTDYVQTKLIVTELKKNEFGFGINLGDSEGVVRIQGCRPNPDGTKSPGQLNPNIQPGDVIYKVQNTLLTGKNPLTIAVETMKQCSTVRLDLLRRVPASASVASMAQSKLMSIPINPIQQELQVYSEMQSSELHQLQYQIMVLRYLQAKRMPDPTIIRNALGTQLGYNQPHPRPKSLQQKRSNKRKRGHSDSDSDEDDDYHIYVAPTDAPRRSLRKHPKKRINYQEAEFEREDRIYENEIKEINEERKNENEVLTKIEAVVGARYRPRPDTGTEELELLIKWKNKSYFHLDWIFKSDFEILGQGAVFRCRHFINKHPHIEHFTEEDTLPSDSEYYDSELASIDRVLWIRDVKNNEGHSTSEMSAALSCYDKVKLYLESSLIQFFYTPYQIYQFHQYIVAMDDLNAKREQIKETSTVTSEEDISTDLQQYDTLEKQYEAYLPELVELPATQKLVLVKWNNQTYDQVTWELDRDVRHEQSKIITFHRNNRIPDSRTLVSPFRPPPESYKLYKQSMPLKNNVVLREYQVEGVNWLIFSWYQRRNCILADEMGLGKTLQSIALLNHFFTAEHIRGPFLILAPLSTLGHWKREIENATDLNVVFYHSPHGGVESRERIRSYEFHYNGNETNGLYKFNVLLTTYNILITDLEVLRDIHWKYLIIDEAQRAKSQNTKLFSALEQIKADAKLLLTGTPLQNNMNELWSLLNLIEPTVFASEADFINRYGNLTDANQVASLHTLLQPYFLRRVKSDVEKNIPPKIETVVDVDLTMLQKKYYRAIYERNRSYLEYDGSSIAQLVSIVTELRKCCNHPFMIRGVIEKETHDDRLLYNQLLVQASGKFVLLSKLLPLLQKEGHQVLIFSQFINTLNLLEDLLAILNFSFDRLDGSVRGDLRQQKIDKFNAGKVFAFLLSTKAGGLGLNLTAADTVIIFDNDWNPQNDVQAEARAHRIGQQKSVHVYRLVTKGTYEEELFSRASRKLGLSQAVFDTNGIHNHFDGPTMENTSDLLDMDVKKIEQLLRYGAYAFSDTGEGGNMIETLDFNEFMKQNSRTFVIKETSEGEQIEVNNDGEKKENDDEEKHLRFNQAAFVGRGKNDVDFTDPQFWDKVLGPRLGEKLLRDLNNILDSKDMNELTEYLQNLSNLVVDVVKEKMNGNIHRDYENVLDILHTLSMSEFYIGSIDVGVMAGRWKEVLELKGRQLRRKKMTTKTLVEEGHSMQIVEFIDNDQNLFRDNWNDSESDTGSKKSKRSRSKRDTEGGERKRRRKTTKEPVVDANTSNLVIQLNVETNEENKKIYSFNKIINADKTSGKKRGRRTRNADNEEKKERSHKTKKNRFEVYFDLNSEIAKASYESYCATCLNRPKDEWYCSVCFGDQNESSNPLVQCARCGCIVHKYCYGIDNSVDVTKPWLCDYCQYVKDNNLPWKGDTLTCPLCYYTGGSYKQTVGGRWIHTLCAVWASEIRFGDELHMKHVSGLEKIPENMKRYKCCFCHKTGSYAIRCDNPACSKHFHPICGRRNNCRMEWVGDIGLQAFCDKHGKKKRQRVKREKESEHEDSYQEGDD